jgi:transcription-repair coupling factor (superfamily II helicase)
MNQSKVYDFLSNKNNCDVVITSDDKESLEIKDCFKYFNIEPFILPDIRASIGDDLKAFNSELFELFINLNSYYNYNKKKVLITTLKTASLKLPKKEHFKKESISFADSININELKDKLFKMGFSFCDIIQAKSEVSIRGDIIDIYPIDSVNPIRISLDMDIVESIRYFDIFTQKSFSEELDKIEFLPSYFTLNDNDFEELNYDIDQIQSNSFEKDLQSLGLWALKNKELITNDKKVYRLNEYSIDIENIYDFDTVDMSKDEMLNFNIIKDTQLYKDIKRPKDIDEFISFHKNKKIEILSTNNLKVQNSSYKSYIKESNLIINIMSNDKIIISLNTPKKDYNLKDVKIMLDDLNIGDYVVHVDYGIGIFQGIEKTTVLGATKDYAVILYKDDDKLLLPVQNINLIDRYIASGYNKNILDRLGKNNFGKLKEKVSKTLLDIAGELINISAQRNLISSQVLDTKIDKIKQFQAQAGFKYTKDQKQSITDIFTDLSSGKPMDRLLSGDVGFGKTEVAMNAILAIVLNKKSAMFIAPTTLLSNQHYKGIKQRFEDFGIRVEKIDGMVTAKNKKIILKKIEDKEVDVIVGTHALLNVQMDNLGLVVIDEEHKFGVKQKEKLKHFRHNLHILSMSATPIPRSLNSALSNIKSLSTLLTPPKDRLPVRTFLKEYDDKLIKEIILREKRRAGQTFYIFNNIELIENKKKDILDILPNIKILVLHSKVSTTVTEKEMIKFENGEYDLLLSTTIVESGIHIPNVNSIIIDNANYFGIADLHQLRGRVGRGNKEGFCYLLIEDKDDLSQASQKRLTALEQNSFLGSGAVLAHHDLEIRGGGNIIGSAQSGHIKGVGYNLYLKMLEDTINKLSGKKAKDNNTKSIEIKLKVNAFLSDELISEDRVRLELYRRLSKCTTTEEIYDIEKEICDRFGKLDTPTKQFLLLDIIKIIALKQDIKTVTNMNQNITLIKNDNSNIRLISATKDDDDIIDTVLKYLKNKTIN